MKTISILIFTAVMLLSSSSSAVDDKEYWLFFSVFPWGKSTLINALKKEYVAETGITITSPSMTPFFTPFETTSQKVLTEYFTSYSACPQCGVGAYSIPGATLINSGLLNYFTPYEDVENNRIYLDTPRLCTTDMRKEAARQTNLLLKQKGKYKIFFLISDQLCSGDVGALNQFMEAIEFPHKLFSIVMNRMEDDEMEFLEKRDNKKVFYEELNRCLTYKTNSILHIARNDNWSRKKINQKDRLLSLSKYQREFLETSPTIEIRNKKSLLLNKKELLKLIYEKYL